jgi:hypothetical protein
MQDSLMVRHEPPEMWLPLPNTSAVDPVHSVLHAAPSCYAGMWVRHNNAQK